MDAFDQLADIFLWYDEERKNNEKSQWSLGKSYGD
jgi:hypothetical protein